MSRSLALAAAAVLTSAPAFAAENNAFTTRIEHSSARGATVTMEEGVRVFRPFPSESHIIVNPDGRTPLGLNYYNPVFGVPVGAPIRDLR